ncbi:MAG: CRISPR-associated endonuclease Cas1 [Deltaproteobacteria bacterium]|nr:CRISPR-associated endonuclease Cas1 [Deltaproteobacteria bacterium]
MGSLYIDSRVQEVRADGQSLTLYAGGRLEGRVPAIPLERVLIQGGVLVDTRALHLLAGQGVEVLLVSGRHGRWRATVIGPEHSHAALRVAQVVVHLDAARRLVFARRWVEAKLAGQAVNVAAWKEMHPRNRAPLIDATVALDRALIGSAEADAESLRGLEGAAARAYFGALQAVLPPAYGFRGRNRRPPLDPVNALLSLTYTLLHGEWAGLLRGAGFDPHVGFFHSLEYGRESLASDLVEPCRPVADRWVVDLVKTGTLRPRDFAMGGERAGCWLRKDARARYYMAYETWAVPLRHGWRTEAYALAREVLREDGDGQPVPDGVEDGHGASGGGEPAD